MFFCFCSIFPFPWPILAVEAIHSLRSMVSSLLVAAAVFLTNPVAATEDSTLVMFWNVENFFGWKAEAMRDKHWTRKKFLRECQAISKAVLWVSDEYGRPPDLIGLAEVEDRKVLETLLRETPLRRLGYGIIHYDSPDPRGIDVALLFRKERLKLLCSKPLRINGLSTRDILLAGFERSGGDSLTVLVNHHPSKYGGNSVWRREAAMARLGEATDSLMAVGERKIVAMGDFNDTPESTAGYSGIMVNLAAPLAKKGIGTIKYSGKWEMIDMFFISPALAMGNPGTEMRVEIIPFLMVKDSAHSGEKPLRTFSGPRYVGGVSDHCPITLVIR